MMIDTELFGRIKIEKDKIIHFKDGLPGFNEEKEFLIIYNDEVDNPIHWLQSVNTPELSFVILNPFMVYDDYEFKISENIVDKLEVEDEEDVVVYTLLTIPENMEKMTTNLLAPIIINQTNKEARQVILTDENYTTKHYVFDQEALNKKEVK